MKRTMLLSALLLLGACQARPTVPHPGAVSASTHATVYTRDPATSVAQIQFTIRNRSSDVLSFGRCDQEVSAEVEQRSSGGWTQASSAICPTHLPMVALQLQPGADYKSRVSIREPGHYRIRLSYGAPGRQYRRTAYSNEFVVR